MQVSHRTNAIFALIASVVALAGWALILSILWSADYEPISGHPVEDHPAHVRNFALYVVMAVVGVVGWIGCTCLSLTGLVMSTLTIRYQPQETLAKAGIVTGAIGVCIALGMVLWRLLVWITFVIHSP